jgi:UPF0755 protein
VIKVFLSVLLVLLITVVLGFQQFQTAITSPLNVTNSMQFEVKKGTGFNQLCLQWKAKGWLDNCFVYQILAKLDPTLTDLKAGLYELTNDTVINNIKKINQGKQISFSFTIIEGQSLRDVINNINKAQYLTNDINIADVAKQIMPNSEYLEGWLFPETYHYHLGDAASSVLKRAAYKMQQTLNTAWGNRSLNLPIKNEYEALILASIIEKETGIASERPIIASVFVNRLNNNMRLQTDPTVIYGLGERYDGDIKRKDLREETPYNTYRIDGLPPTPIAMPSKAAILAALNPPETKYFYFVAKGIGDGSHQFSTTLQQHNAAVKNYLLNNKN